jgi:perosamine synthetase
MQTNKPIPVSRPCFGDVESAYLSQALISGRITMGPMVEVFEEMLRNHFGHDVHVVSCSSGTAALHLALSSYDFDSDCEVLVPDLTYIATANAVAYTGARVVLVDVDRNTWTIDIEDCKRKITNHTVAIMPVHLYGMPCDMDKVDVFAKDNDLIVIEDAAEALGATYASMPCGLMGDAGCFSFYGNKLITTAEGGCIVTHDEDFATELRLRRGQGQSLTKRFYHEVVGFNYRMSDLHAAIGIAQLSRLNDFIEAREKIFKLYDAALDLERQHESEDVTVAPWLYTVLLEYKAVRDLVASTLAEMQIETRNVFIPLHRQPMFKRDDAQFPVSSYLADRGLSLPTYVGLTSEDVARISDGVMSCMPKMKLVSKG